MPRHFIMIKCISFQFTIKSDDFESKLSQARAGGFDGLELKLPSNSLDGDFIAPTHHLTDLAQAQHLAIAAVSSDEFDLFSLAVGRNRADQAVEYFIKQLELARRVWPDAVVIINAGDNSPDRQSITSYESAFNNLFTSLEALAQQAGELSMTLALENPAEALLLSPLELRDLIDEVNNPYFGLCFNPAHIPKSTDPFDWLKIMDT